MQILVVAGNEFIRFFYKDNSISTSSDVLHTHRENPHVRRQCGPVVRALALRSGDPGFKTRSDHSLNLILVVPGSTCQLHL